MTGAGTVIDGKYELLKPIGRGGMSVVYLAMDNRLKKSWAVKEIQKEVSKNGQIMVQSLLAEANMLKKLDHPMLPRIVDIIDKDDSIFVVMDFIEGESLNHVLERDFAQPQENVIEWAKQLCGALEYLHTRKPPIVYRDMKPSNIMLLPEGRVKLIDFGTAREYKENNLSDTISLGTRGYAAPEQFDMSQTDARTDIYCLGATLYHLVTGQNPSEPPYEIKPIRQWNPALSSGLEKIILKCTRQNPAERYQSCAELLYALEHYDEEDSKHRRKQAGRLAVFAASALFCLGSLTVSAVGLKGINDINSNTFNSIVKSAQGYDDLKQYGSEITAYKKALEEYPALMRQDDYVNLLTAYERNGQVVEGTQFFADLIKNKNTALQQKPELCRIVALNYFIHYKDFNKNDTQSNQITPFSQANTFFQYAQKSEADKDDAQNDQNYEKIAQFMDKNQSGDQTAVAKIISSVKFIDSYYGSSQMTGNDAAWVRNKMCLVAIEYNNITQNQTALLTMINTDAEQVLAQLSSTTYSSTLSQQQISSDKILMEFFDAEAYMYLKKYDSAIAHYTNCLALGPSDDIANMCRQKVAFCGKSKTVQ